MRRAGNSSRGQVKGSPLQHVFPRVSLFCSPQQQYRRPALNNLRPEAGTPRDAISLFHGTQPYILGFCIGWPSRVTISQTLYTIFICLPETMTMSDWHLRISNPGTIYPNGVENLLNAWLQGSEDPCLCSHRLTKGKESQTTK